MCGCGNGVNKNVEAVGGGQVFTVGGMSCQPCATKVTTVVEAVVGTESVAVDLSAGTLTVTGTASAADIQAAVTGAGYQIQHA